MFDVQKSFVFSAAHHLPNVTDQHKCSRLHGHAYTVTLTARGVLNPLHGWVIDFAKLEAAGESVRQKLDHRYLNDIAGLHNPTSECIAKWIWDRMRSGLPELYSVTVAESPTSSAVYYGDGA
jgi:6-pyruvoyltetrahydropterin/6-carboxytetrahydropterin synthase